MYDHVPEEHLIPRGKDRGVVLSKPFGKPERRLADTDPPEEPVLAGNDVVLKYMDEFVSYNPVEFAHGTAEGDRHPALQVLCEAEDSFRDLVRDNVGLLEVLVGGVDYERHPPDDLVIHFLPEEFVTPLGLEECEPGDVFLLPVVIDVEVFTLHHLPVELGVADLVFPESGCLS